MSSAAAKNFSPHPLPPKARSSLPTELATAKRAVGLRRWTPAPATSSGGGTPYPNRAIREARRGRTRRARGKLAWYFQYTPNDSWDYDEIGVHMLYDLPINGQARKVVGHFSRNGFFYTF